MNKQLFLLAFLFPFTSALAASEAHLTFHMGVGADAKYYIGGTVINKGDSPLAMGYINVLIINKKCTPQHVLVHNFGSIAPAGKYSFKIPVQGKLEGYRLAGFGAFDELGFPVTAIDDTKDIIAQREGAERSKCLLARKTEK